MALFANSFDIPHTNYHTYSFKKYNGMINMAIDHYFASTSKKVFNPIIRFYGWQPYCLSLGFHQKSDSINKDMLNKDKFDLVRRPTGGRAIFHSEEFTYSVIFPKNLLHHKKLYNFIHSIFTLSLNALGFKVNLAYNKTKIPRIKEDPTDYPCFTKFAETEVEYNNKKLIGSAQKIYPNAILQHGSILIGNSHLNLSKYIKASEKQTKKLESELNDKTICLNMMNDYNINPIQIEKETITQLESNNNISLIFKEINRENLDKALNLYKQNFTY